MKKTSLKTLLLVLAFAAATPLFAQFDDVDIKIGTQFLYEAKLAHKWQVFMDSKRELLAYQHFSDKWGSMVGIHTTTFDKQKMIEDGIHTLFDHKDYSLKNYYPVHIIQLKDKVYGLGFVNNDKVTDFQAHLIDMKTGIFTGASKTFITLPNNKISLNLVIGDDEIPSLTMSFKEYKYLKNFYFTVSDDNSKVLAFNESSDGSENTKISSWVFDEDFNQIQSKEFNIQHPLKHTLVTNLQCDSKNNMYILCQIDNDNQKLFELYVIMSATKEVKKFKLPISKYNTFQYFKIGEKTNGDIYIFGYTNSTPKISSKATSIKLFKLDFEQKSAVQILNSPTDHLFKENKKQYDDYQKISAGADGHGMPYTSYQFLPDKVIFREDGSIFLIGDGEKNGRVVTYIDTNGAEKWTKIIFSYNHSVTKDVLSNSNGLYTLNCTTSEVVLSYISLDGTITDKVLLSHIDRIANSFCFDNKTLIAEVVTGATKDEHVISQFVTVTLK